MILVIAGLVYTDWPSSGKYVIGCFFALALLFDGLGLVATGFGGRRIVHLVSGRPADESGEPEAKPVQPE